MLPAAHKTTSNFKTVSFVEKKRRQEIKDAVTLNAGVHSLMALDGQRVAKRSGWFCADGTTKAVSDVKFKTCTDKKSFQFSERVDEPTATRRTQKKIKAKEILKIT